MNCFCGVREPEFQWKDFKEIGDKGRKSRRKGDFVSRSKEQEEKNGSE